MDGKIVNLLLATYFAIIGAFALAATVDPILVRLIGSPVRRLGPFSLTGVVPYEVSSAHWLTMKIRSDL